MISSFPHMPHPTHQHVFLVLPLYHIRNHHLYHCFRATTLSPSGHITSHLDSYRSRWVSYFYLSSPIFYFPCSSSQSASFKIHLITSIFCSYPSIDFSFAQSEIPSFYCGLWPYLHVVPLHWWPLPCFHTLNVLCLGAFALTVSPVFITLPLDIFMVHSLTFFRSLFRCHLSRRQPYIST